MPKYSLNVVTYINRFEKFFVPLVRQLEKYFPGVEKNYILNGYYDQEAQAAYLKKAREFLRGTSAGQVIAYDTHQALAKCWNQLVIHSQAEKAVILNDDILIRRPFFWFLGLQIGRFDSATINNSWSHFFISKSTIKKVGWFDERFAGMGDEDGDFALRLAMAEHRDYIKDKHLHNIYCLGVTNLVATDLDPGWKKKSDFFSGKYAKVNRDFFLSKWEKSPVFKPGFIGAFGDGYYRLRDGQTTPQFYDIHILD